MKILHVASADLWAGAEVQLCTLATHQARHSGFSVAAFLLNEGELAVRLRQAGVEVHVCGEDANGFVKTLLVLRRIIRRMKPNVVHTHRQKENLLGSLAAWNVDDVRCVRTVHGADEFEHKRIQGRLLKWFDRLAGNYLQDAIISVSEDLAWKLKQKFHRTPVITIKNGVDIDLIRAVQPNTAIRQPPSAIMHVGFVGRLAKVKRPDLFLEIVESCMAQRDSAMHFHIIGTGPLRDVVTEVILARGLSGAITQHGHRGDSLACIAALDSVVICSDHEGLPMTALEAVAAGTSVVAHAVGGLREVLPQEALVSSQNPDEYAAILIGMLDDGVVPIAIRKRSKLAPGYSASENASAVLSLYRNVF